MGQAKNRGTAEERRQTALERNSSQAVNLIKQGTAPHYAFILDRTATGQNTLHQMKNGPAEIKARATSAAVQLWESATHFEYVVIWGTWGYSGGLTIPTTRLEILLNQTLPAVMAKTIEKGGLCAFIPAIDESKRDAVMAKVAELQPTSTEAIN